MPSADQVTQGADRLRAAVAAMLEAGDTATAALERRAKTIELALRMHADEGEIPCPVCNEGTLTDSWAATAGAQVDEFARQLERLRTAQQQLKAARADARALIAPLPAALSLENPELQLELQLTREAWSAWTDAPGDDFALVEHLLHRHGDVAAALEELRAAVRGILAARDDAWSRVASQLAAFAADAEAWKKHKGESEAAKAALKWLKDNEGVLKNERMKPIAAQAGAIWEKLRQESNVELAGITLAGSATRRHVVISASVDGSEAAGLAVMSQGELHALALALFLPRATMPQSPFRFVILDDPVQAMDPAKVDGLVEVLGELAKDRQVVVFSHDDRLASAVRRSHVDATIVEVTRATGSKVTVVEAFDPPRRYLRDASALLKDDGVPDATARRVLPGLLRFAAEAQARDRYFAQSLAAGRTHAEVEAGWAAAKKTSQRLSLAIHGEEKQLDGWLGKHPHRKRGLGVITSGMHTPLQGDVGLAVEDVQRLVDDIRSGVK